jgi:hypothetical protein
MIDDRPQGDGLNSGVLGLAYPALTSAHPPNATNNTQFLYNRLPYDPVLFTMYKQGLIDPYFSIALARNPQNSSALGFGGYLSIGTIPPVQHSNNFVAVAVEIDDSVPTILTANQRTRAYWALTVSAMIYGPGNTSTPNTPTPNNITTAQTVTNSTKFQAFLDDGNYFSYLPTESAAAINAFFSPPAILDPASGMYIVNCAATPPQLGLTIGDQTFFHDGRDLLYQTADPASGEGLCVSAIQSSSFSGTELGSGVLNIIGAPLFKNVLTVFNFGNNTILLSQLEGEVTQGDEGTGSGDGGSGGGNSTSSGGGGGGSGTGNGSASANRGNILGGGSWLPTVVTALVLSACLALS